MAEKTDHPNPADQSEVPTLRGSRASAAPRPTLRAIILKHWKTKRTIARRLIRLGVTRRTAWRRVYEGHKSIWALSHAPAVERGLRDADFAKRGFEPLRDRFERIWATISAPVQLWLPLEFERSQTGRRRGS